MATIADNTFARACFEQNTIAELETALSGEADQYDCAEWNLTSDEWRAQIEAALSALREKESA